MSASRKSDRRWFQFSLSSLFWLTTLVAIVCAAGRAFGWDTIGMCLGAPFLFVGALVLFLVLSAGPLLVVIFSDLLRTTVRKIAAICGIGVFLLVVLFVLADSMTRSRDSMTTLIVTFELFSGILTWWGVQSLILWWMIRTARSADTGAKLRRHTWPESINFPSEDQDSPDA